jgi:transglutaminase-like putative cysteine protease
VARRIGLGVPAAAEADRSLRRISLLFTEAFSRDPRHLTVHRDISDYLYVTCRDFALLAVSALREQRIPTRLRVGFASYFNPRYREDHWVCEYRVGESWAILDAQLGPRARAGFRIAFDVADVPDTCWRSAASVWRAVRSGQLNPVTLSQTSSG